MTGEKEMLSARIPVGLKERVRRDPRNNQQVVEDALEREFATEDEAAVLDRIEELNDEMGMLQDQKERRENKISEKQAEKERLQSQLEAMEKGASKEREAVVQKAAKIPADPDHPFVIDNAESLDMTPEDLAREIAETHGKEYDPTDDDDELRSL